jgi:BirA family biotin operon repressor/biotin-[acetyl-CoA-carboxylase] ligase
MPLDPQAIAAGVRLIAHDSIGSTNSEAKTLALAGERGPLWIMAARQTAGRGRRGNTWVSEPGNLYASLLLIDAAPPQQIAGLSFVAALAVHDAVMDVAPGLGARLAVKWPNDLLIDGKKFAGILIESEGPAVIVGVGINCAHHPAATAYPATDLSAAGVTVSPEQLLQRLSGRMLSRLGQWDRGTGFAAIRADWLARVTGLGQEIRVRLPHRELTGQFQALNENGGLLLRLADGSVEVVNAGEIFTLAGSPEMLPAQ